MRERKSVQLFDTEPLVFPGQILLAQIDLLLGHRNIAPVQLCDALQSLKVESVD